MAKKGTNLIPSNGGRAKIDRQRKVAGIHVSTMRRIGDQIISSEKFKKQLEKEIFDQDKAIQFLAVLAKYNPASAHEGLGGGGGINIQINTMVDRNPNGLDKPVNININSDDIIDVDTEDE